MRLLLDSNIVVRLLHPSDPLHSQIVASIHGAVGHHVMFTVPQVLAECWAVLTRPAEANGYGFEPDVAATSLTDITVPFPLLADPEGLTHEWLRLGNVHRVRGRQIHDARLAAAVLVHHLDGLVTLNGPDFGRYPISIFRPDELT